MTDYVIGDVQGCFDALMALVDRIGFDDRRDRLFFTGDLINRGGQSLAVLRWVFAHQHCCASVLGNHDLSVLYRYHRPRKRMLSPEIIELFNASEADLLLDWLAHQPLLHEIDNSAGDEPWWLCHAGIYPLWDAGQARTEARYAEFTMWQNPDVFFDHLFGDRPCRPVPDGGDALKRNKKTNPERVRFAVNAFTRMRFVDSVGCLDFDAKGPPEKFPHLYPWFRAPNRVPLPATVLYGHWSALGLHEENRTVCLDTGKVWGGRLTALRLPETAGEEMRFVSV